MADEMKKIQRLSPYRAREAVTDVMRYDDDGDFVRYADYMQRIADLEARIEKIRNPTIYTGTYYAIAEIPIRCPECDGNYFTSHGPKGMVCAHCLYMEQADRADELVKELETQLARLSAPVSDEEWKSQSFLPWMPSVRQAIDALITARAARKETQ